MRIGNEVTLGDNYPFDFILHSNLVRGDRGVIVAFDTADNVGVDWGREVRNGHDAQGRGTPKQCWFVRSVYLTLINSEDEYENVLI